MAYHSSVGCDRRGDQPTGYATPSACFHTPEITITQWRSNGMYIETIDRRMQYLRKKGLVANVRGKGWVKINLS
ncbi:hypothetical protein A0P09_20130 [Salmonella enterica]|nr:hypothetical protein [Salmonella enterica]ECJ6335471.1 hypothetical protein [Salmonella enterica]ECJ6468995.1 hypothetical protein [Salmonella enterica]